MMCGAWLATQRSRLDAHRHVVRVHRSLSAGHQKASTFPPTHDLPCLVVCNLARRTLRSLTVPSYARIALAPLRMISQPWTDTIAVPSCLLRDTPGAACAPPRWASCPKSSSPLHA